MNNDYHVLFLVGLPGSGKSYYGHEFLKSNPNYIFVDDCSRIELENALSNNAKIIVANPWFVVENARKQAIALIEKYTSNIEFVFFENNPQQCIRNVEFRNDNRKVFGFIKSMTKQYVIPKENEFEYKFQLLTIFNT